MKPSKLLVTLFVLSLPIAVLLGCAQQNDGAGTKATVEQKASGIAPASTYLSELYSSYDTFDKGIKDGSSIPLSLELFVTDTIDGYVYDKHVIVAVWNELSKLRIDLDHPKQDEVKGNRISFSFDSGSEVITFPFRTTEYMEFTDKTQFGVENPQKVQELVDMLTVLVQEQMPKPGDELVERNGAYYWDADGDQMLEHMRLDVIANGDEAPNVMDIHLYNTGMDVSASLNHAYTVKRVVLKQDAKGPYVVMEYEKGDYYKHDIPAKCTIRLVGDKLECTES
jgi:hypothetical protein